VTRRLSVVIPTRDRPQMLERCLASVVASIGGDDEVIVVDSASQDAAAVAAVAERAGASTLRCDDPGASTARNRGWQHAQAELVAFVDDDVWVAPDWADALVRCAHAHPDAAWIAGRIDAPEDGESAVRPVAILNRTEAAALDASTPSGRLGHSANLVVRRAALARVGGFDEVLGAGGPLRAAEDLDLIDRIVATGAGGRFEPEARAWHDQWRTRGQLIRLDWSYGIGNGARLSKLVRAPDQRARARREFRTAMWSWGLQQAFIALRQRFETRALMDFARVGGNFVGFARGMVFANDDGHLRRRRAATPSRPSP